MPAVLFDSHLGLWLGHPSEGFPYRGNKKGIFNTNRDAPVVVGLDLRTAKEPTSFEWRRAPTFIIDGKSSKEVLPSIIAKSKCPSCAKPKLAWAEVPDGQVACLACGGMFDLAVFTRDAGYPVLLQWSARLEGKWAAGDEKAVIEQRPLYLNADGAQATKAAIEVARHSELRGFAGSQEVDDKGLAALGDQPKLAVLRLWYSPKLTASAFGAIAKYPTLENLDIGNNAVLDDRTVPFLPALKGLTSLVLDQTKVGDETLAVLAKLDKLEAVSLNSTKITDDGIAALKKHPTLRTLRLGWTKIGPDALKHLAKLPKLEWVETFDCTELPAAKRGRLTRAELTA